MLDISVITYHSYQSHLFSFKLLQKKKIIITKYQIKLESKFRQIELF